MNISVVVPSYKNPKYLDLCLHSLLHNLKGQKPEIIVVLDGYPELSKDVIKKYENNISVLEFEENKGMPTAINYGVYNASNQWIMVLPEDIIVSKDWYEVLIDLISNTDNKSKIFSINLVEPLGPSIYKYIIKNYGITKEEFDIEKFWQEEISFRKSPFITEDGSTFPFLIRKKDFLRMGGFDADYPSPFVVDWDFFLKAELNNIELLKYSGVNFYHFVSKSTKNRNGYIENPNERMQFFSGENKAAEYFEYKWGFKPLRDKNNKCCQFIS